MCDCGGGSGSGGGFGSGSWENRLRYRVKGDGWVLHFSNMRDAQRHKDAYGGSVEIVNPGQASR